MGGERVEAFASGARGVCPVCASPAVARCGSLVVHHWAHVGRARQDCDPWFEPEGPWHRRWKSLVSSERQEVVIGQHRADLVLPNGAVVELQHSTISGKTIGDRESYYAAATGRSMCWVFDATESKDFRLSVNLDSGAATWACRRRDVRQCRERAFIDSGLAVDGGFAMMVSRERVYSSKAIADWIRRGVSPRIMCRSNGYWSHVSPAIHTVEVRREHLGQDPMVTFSASESLLALGC